MGRSCGGPSAPSPSAPLRSRFLIVAEIALARIVFDQTPTLARPCMYVGEDRIYLATAAPQRSSGQPESLLPMPSGPRRWPRFRATSLPNSKTHSHHGAALVRHALPWRTRWWRLPKPCAPRWLGTMVPPHGHSPTPSIGAASSSQGCSARCFCRESEWCDNQSSKRHPIVR